ncbi:carcinoembryonic antigen-related cell adhesion molecule 1-like [Engraulis encrasicolus]|uniref:carcinoembryonic antigen-related cell adhesion molecule 1-like n=1 Tax=Engraulis encrasicolus TaxID=184585 RepID=UPI002FD0DCDD
MDSQVFFTVWMLTAVEGGSVEFRLINPPSAAPDGFTWNFGSTQICTATGGPPFISPCYRNRVSVDPTTATLELRDLTLSDTGEYNLNIVINSVENNAAATLTVFERISSVTLVASHTDLVEFNSSVTLTCSASGSPTSFQWFNRSDEVTGSDGGTLTIESVTRYDTGPYKCNASNIVSFGMSSEVTMTIAYGPDTADIRVTPAEEFYSSGSTIVLSCSSESSPAAQIQWALNGTLLGREGPELRLENVQPSQSGEYTCWAHNSKTLRYKLSSPTSVTVLERISEPAITMSGPEQLIANKSSVSLTCEAKGFITTREWMKDGETLSPCNRITFSEDNRTVSISVVLEEDEGEYKCRLSSPVSNEEASKQLTVGE